MSEWVRLDTKALNGRQLQPIRGMNVSVRMSPYDVPEAVRSHFDKVGRCFVVEFKYMVDDEPVSQKREGEHVTLRVGRNSLRLYGIEVDVDGMDGMSGNSISLTQAHDVVFKAISDTLDHAPPKPSIRENYVVAKDAIARNRTEIFADLVNG